MDPLRIQLIAGVIASIVSVVNCLATLYVSVVNRWRRRKRRNLEELMSAHDNITYNNIN